jgi:hypothetical protein
MGNPPLKTNNPESGIAVSREDLRRALVDVFDTDEAAAAGELLEYFRTRVRARQSPGSGGSPGD